ncbi:MAG: IS66 family insertion sequence element accessory protein TnpB [Lachnospiraceae bacterium]|nr:IS66 family insertion sequence element accessory protein TnpB [Lachnospiraceae bacterium]MDD6811293.1 IS66 family insertion sequence element accessory protein TnpB [Lachnospiraceae bacterium]
MARYQSSSRSDEEWFRIINECRRSGLSNSQWCKQHDVRESTFFCAVIRLSKKAYAIPNRDKSIDILSAYLPKQDVVRIDIKPEPMQLSKTKPMQVMPATYLDNSHTIEIDVHGINIRVFNSIDRELLKIVLSALGGVGC